MFISAEIVATEIVAYSQGS